MIDVSSFLSNRTHDDAPELAPQIKNILLAHADAPSLGSLRSPLAVHS
jgi:hypothetical protein